MEAQLPMIDWLQLEDNEIHVSFMPTDDVSKFEKESTSFSISEFRQMIPESHILYNIISDKESYCAHCGNDVYVVITKFGRFEVVHDVIFATVGKAAQNRFASIGDNL